MKQFNKPEDVLRKWLDGVNKGEVEDVLSLYSEDAVLLPTFSNRMFSTPEGIRGYFQGLGAKKNLRVELHEKPFHAIELSENIYFMSGIYCWKMEVDGEVLSFEARFTYNVNLKLAAPILHHHSSQLPRTL